MEDSWAQANAPIPRRSMLPQRHVSKPSSIPLFSVSERKDTNDLKSPNSDKSYQPTTTSNLSHPGSLCRLPPSISNNHRVTRPSSGIVHLQRVPSMHNRSGIGKVAGQDCLLPSNGKCTSYNEAHAKVLGKALTHGRSLSPRVPLHIASSTSSSRSSSRASKVETVNKAFDHRRSISQQIPRSSAHSGASQTTRLSRQSSLRNQKPVLSVRQEHCTPKKLGKPLEHTSTILHQIEDSMSAADISHLQMELTRLHLLHRSASTNQAKWKQSAKKHFQQQFTVLHERQIELREIAQQQKMLINQLALVQWSHGKTGPQIADKVQLLSRTISDVYNLIDTDGKYTNVLEIFESWFTQALRIREQREPTNNADRLNIALTLIEGIGDGWKAEALVLERELTYCQREIKAFGVLRTGSILGTLLPLYNELVEGLLEELDVVQWVENEVMARETGWIEHTIHDLAGDVSCDIGSAILSPESVQS